MGEFNPYEAPATGDPGMTVPAWGDGGIWREGGVLVMAREARLPDLCVKCAAPADGYRLRRKLSWHPWPIYLLIIFCNLLVYLIVALIVRKTATIHVGLCERHRSRRRSMIATAWALALAGIGLMIAAGSSSGEDRGMPLALAGLVALLAGLIVGAIASQVVTPTKIDAGYLWLKGFHPAYLAEFPDLASARLGYSAGAVEPKDAFDELA